jgi:hypothetical protein
VEGGQLVIRSSSSDATSGLVTVADTLRLQGQTAQVKLQRGGVLTAGILMTSNGRGTVSGNLTGGRGVLLIKARSASGCDKFNVKGTLTLNSDTIRIRPLKDGFMTVGQSMKIFTGNVPVAGSTWVIDCPGYTFDDSQLTTDGTLTLVSTTGIGAITAEGRATVYTTDGRLVGTGLSEADIARLPNGLYIVNGKKVAVQH